MFSSLRANDLIWPYVVNSYLKGKAPPAFDLLYWNADGTNLPGPMFCWYVRNMYLENNLRVPGKTVQCGDAGRPGAIDIPAFVYASREDHIVPWKTAYASTRTARGATPLRAGRERAHRGRDQPAGEEQAQPLGGGEEGRDPEQWLATATNVPGSWWPRWSEWLERHAGDMIPAPRSLGNRKYRRIEAAPGRYVMTKAD